MSNKPLTECKGWKDLEDHHKKMENVYMRDMFTKNPARAEHFSLKLDGLFLDYSKHIITEETMEKLLCLANDCDIEKKRDEMLSGAHVNTSENQPALHTALRGFVDKDLNIDNENILDFVNKTLKHIEKLSNDIRSNENFTDIVNIGIGGSYLGPHSVCEALKDYAGNQNIHFVSNIDGSHITQTLKSLKPKSTLFIVSSKSFTTLETMANAKIAKDWIGSVNENNHFIAITANESAAREFGIKDSYILPMRNWMGGRYSLWSAIGLPIAIYTGFDVFKDLLAGARNMDKHFQETPLDKNMPVIMAMLGIWYRNFWNYNTHAISPYAQNLHKFPAYVQQLDMESNGKNIDKEGHEISYNTSPVVFGETGTNAQHAFFQMLHQGSDIIPVDFIAFINANHTLNTHHTQLLSNALAQSQALMNGSTVKNEMHRKFKGNRPSSTILLNKLDAYNLGMLLALYEHKIFVQGCIWNINSFDQWGVELGKELAKNITNIIENNETIQETDSSTQNLIHHIQAYKNKNS